MSGTTPLTDAVCQLIDKELRQFDPAGSPRRIEPDNDLVEDLDCDGIDLFTIAIALEDQFEITIGDEDIEDWKLVANVIATVERATSK